MTATTRESTAPVSHAVHPRFEAPETTKCSIFWPRAPPPHAQCVVMVSIARTTAFAIGRRGGQVSSPVRRNLSQA